MTLEDQARDADDHDAGTPWRGQRIKLSLEGALKLSQHELRRDSLDI